MRLVSDDFAGCRLSDANETPMVSAHVIGAAAHTVRLLPSELTLTLIGTSAAITGTLAVMLDWIARHAALVVLMLVRKYSASGPIAQRMESLDKRRALSIESLGALASGAAALGTLLGLVFVFTAYITAHGHHPPTPTPHTK
jgi:hypothetical protein